jgi:hypothetical protein
MAHQHGSSSRSHVPGNAYAGNDPARGAAVRNAARVVGAVFLLVGVLGFIPGITTDYDQMQLAGEDSGAMLLGLFEVSVLHNVVHLLFGVAGLALAKNARSAASYLVVGGVVYLALFVYGMVVGERSDANFVPLNDADNWLHLLLGLGMVALGIVLGKKDDVDHR